MAYTSPPNDDRPSSYLPPNSSNRSYDKPSSHLSPNSSNRLYFTDQASRFGYGVPVDSRETEFQRYSRDLRDPVQREIEKDRIRAEIMAEQMERRRILEEEVRMELMVEREMTLQRWESSRMRFDATPEILEFVHEPSSRPRFDARSKIRESLHEPSRTRFDFPETRQYVHEPSRISQPRLPLPLLPMVPSHPVAGLGIFGSLPFQHHPMPPTTSNLVLRETKPFPEPRNERILGSSPFQLHPPATSNVVLREIKPLPQPRKEKILLAKREPNVSDPNRKRKASTLGADHHRTSNLEKKPKGGWNCKLCNISTTSEKTLIDHFKGKKHKLMEEEEGLAHKTGFNSNAVMKKEFTLNTDKPGPSHPNAKKITKTDELKPSETPRADVTMVDKKQKSKLNETSRVEVAMADKKQNSKMNGSVKIREQWPATTPGNVGSVKKNKFWCELCQVGVNSEVVLAGHEKGRRHLENLEEKKRKK